MGISIKNKKILDYDEESLENLVGNITDELLEQEASIIRENFSKQEIKKLVDNISNIDGTNISECIYGTMLGTCYHPRVLEVIEKLPVLLSNVSESIGVTVNHGSSRSVYTPIETYIMTTDVENDMYFDRDIPAYMDIASYRKRVEKVINLITKKNEFITREESDEKGY